MDNRRKAAIAIGAVLALALVVAFFNLRRAARSVPVLTVGYAPFTIGLPESGVIQYPQIQTISSQIAGNVGRIYVRMGDRVVAGQLLATLENPQALANAQSTAAAYRSAVAKAESATVTGGSNVVQAQANLATARARLVQAQQDLANGVQSGLGYGETTAANEIAAADANLLTASTNLREARRIYFAYRGLYANKAVSHDQLDQTEAKYEEAQAQYDQARSARAALGSQLTGSKAVLEGNLRSAREGYAQAQAQLAAAQVESGSGDVAAARAEAERAGSEYALAREQADAMHIHAPYDATVLSVASEKNDPLRPLQSGDAVEAGQPLLTLAGQRGFVVRTRVDEQDIVGVALGQRVQISGDDFPGRSLTGRVVEISPIAQRSGDAAASARTVATTIAIDRPPPFLRDGMSAEITILTTDLPRAIAVPDRAIGRDGAGAYVYVVTGGSAHRRPVRAGAATETATVIESGLRPGDVIVARDVSGLHDGDRVVGATPDTGRP